MTLYERLPNLIDGVNRLALRTGIRRRVYVCPCCSYPTQTPHFVARRVDRMPDGAM